MAKQDSNEQILNLLTSLDKKVSNLEDKFVDMREDFNNKLVDLSMNDFQIRAELREEAKRIQRKLDKMHDDQNSIIKFFNEDYLKPPLTP
ncbi:MAG: hypothetical protein US86_C0007G0104 [Candidatus Daviesbacteria bacterium GW2011_GWA2_38_24]|uniref:Uncharacterized protein n=1 Tax=Candidatus Daviesbacteria bacterium GW2011_GWA2_38_24 TaxID=1618422 RepID=A0A0G0LXA9_9BACT|nr:MAG: hypothetical protein US86_C0007G0104 [Candidatus Daviesbacteria bacterium GW2011_GWA2_38_24]KKQ78774.1 MAG: hypothetical protein UT01_C0060G0008 [Candidatus Daviesbacteria bacterium GW2011_GWA1_38_7]OGE22710.1 MAG: hypothetical protein A2688_02895 [Candidatus Daviesbacteria bacterium RIFCSPHIGHO2_01_FULL_38_8]